MHTAAATHRETEHAMTTSTQPTTSQAPCDCSGDYTNRTAINGHHPGCASVQPPAEITDFAKLLERKVAKLTEDHACARATLVANVQHSQNVQQLATALAYMATCEGELTLYATAARILANTQDLASLRKYVTELVLRGPDDSWSGRTNDARRALYDGTLQGASSVLADLA
jgi:hypothetical protein